MQASMISCKLGSKRVPRFATPFCSHKIVVFLYSHGSNTFRLIKMVYAYFLLGKDHTRNAIGTGRIPALHFCHDSTQLQAAHFHALFAFVNILWYTMGVEVFPRIRLHDKRFTIRSNHKAYVGWLPYFPQRVNKHMNPVCFEVKGKKCFTHFDPLAFCFSTFRTHENQRTS